MACRNQQALSSAKAFFTLVEGPNPGVLQDMLGLQQEATYFSEGAVAFIMTWTSLFKLRGLLVLNSSSPLLDLTVSSANGPDSRPAPVVLKAWSPDQQQPSPRQKYKFLGLPADQLGEELSGWAQHSVLPQAFQVIAMLAKV